MDLPVYLPVLLVLSWAAVVYEGWSSWEKQRRLKCFAREFATTAKGRGKGLFKAAEKLLGWYGSKKEIEYRLARAGNPRFIGESVGHFYASKLVLALVVGLFVGKEGLLFVAFALAGFFFPDILIWIGGKKRQEQVLEELPVMLDFLRRSLAGGTGMPAALAALPERLQGPLKEEAVRLSAYYNITYNLDAALDDFAKRVGLDEVDNMVLALKQSEHTGRVKKLLYDQCEMLKTRMAFDQKKSTQNRANFLPLVSVLMVINIFILVGAPLALRLMGDNFFHH
ncbi:MAG: type II secretion system F family protein [Peptococcaceae bacterium]|nr:type II secretion system F family protein [Peptococcaceae bacterium]